MGHVQLETRIVDLTVGDDGAFDVCSPGVGWWDEPPLDGMLLGPASSVGTLQTLNRRWSLVLPAGGAGRVEGVGEPMRRAVEHGQVLLRLLRIDTGVEAGGQAGRAGALAGDADGFCVSAPTDGVFYHRVSPESPPLVAVGDTLRNGQPVGLIEVMKTFNQVLYGAAGLPEAAEVLEILVADGAEVRAGQTLFRVR